MNTINLKTLSLDELAGVVNLYPWFGAARKELCLRMSNAGGEAWGVSQYADQALYMPMRSVICGMVKSDSSNYSDGDIETILKSYIEEKAAQENRQVERPVRVVGGDYFSQSEYDNVRKEEDTVFQKFTIKTPKKQESDGEPLQDLQFCTETLAAIYADQGYYEQAKNIYSKLILAFPEKSAYFASLIGKLDKEINK